MLAANRIALIHVKVERAYQHLAELQAFVSQSPPMTLQSLTIVDGIGTGRPKPVFSPQLVYGAKLPAIAGDVVHNLRSALDHLALQLVEAGLESGTVSTEPEWERNIQFPIFDSFEGYEKAKARRVYGMTGEAKAAIDDLKPY